MRFGVRKDNNQGLIVTTAGPDLVHDMPVLRVTSFVVRKVMWSNNTGANITIIFGTQTNALAWVPLFPTILCVNGLDGELDEAMLPAVEFRFDQTAGAGTTGDLMVQASAINLILRAEVEE